MTTTNIKTEHYGDVQVWKEVARQSTAGYEVWAAAGTDVHGRGHRGYGGGPQSAVISVLENMEMGRLDGLAPLASDPPQGDLVPKVWVDEAASQVEAGVDYIQKTYGDRVDLPQRFWYLATHGQKIPAIKMLREVTKLSLVSAKDIVDRIADATPRPVYAFGFTASEQPIGTIIRINGDLDVNVDPSEFGGFVFEKLISDLWNSAGDEADYGDGKIEELVRKHGYEILYLPKAAR